MTDDLHRFCFDCGFESPEYVSLNQGVFLCFNCAVCIHQKHYPVEVSCIKSMTEDKFNYVQLKVLINGGNSNAFEFFSLYDLHQEPT